jgi:transposase
MKHSPDLPDVPDVPDVPDLPGRAEPNAADEFDWYVGIDCGGATHRVCVLDARGARVAERAVAHSGEALGALGAWLHALAGPSLARVAVGLETPHGGPVALCLAAGAAVFAINPKQLERFRERASAAGAKDDRRDAYVAAAALRTDRAAFHRVRLEDARLVAVRELSRAGDELREEAARLSNQLRAQLERYFPQVLTLAPGADEPWLWALLAEAPTPAAARRLSERRLARLLRASRIRRLSGAEVRAALQAPALPAVPGLVEAVSDHVGLLLPRLELVTRQRRAWAARLEAALDALAAPDDAAPPPSGAGPNAAGGPPGPAAAPDAPDAPDAPYALGGVVRLLRSLPGVGVGVTGVLLAEAGGALLAGDYHALRTQAGAAPVTKQSGKQRLVVMRRACNPRLRAALFHWARVSLQHDPAARRYYTTLRERGHSHARTLRSLADRWLRILRAMLRTGTPYDARRFATAAPTP